MPEPIKLNGSKMPPTSDEEPREPIRPVVKGKVVKRDSKWIRVQRGGSEIVSHVIHEIVLPEVKDMLFKSFQETVGRSLFGNNYSTPAARGNVRQPGYVSYNKVAVAATARPEPRYSRRNNTYDDIILETRAEADAVIDALDGLIRRYGSASVSDLNELVGVTGSYTDVDWGWFNMRGAASRRITDGFILDLPKPEPLR